MYFPPKSKREYINAASKERDGKIIAHSCSKCKIEYPIKQKGIWFESVARPDVWYWTCKPCCEKRGLWHDWL